MGRKIQNVLKTQIFISLLALIEGLFCGVLGSLFAKTIALVTNIRQNNFWLVFFIGFAGLLSVLIFNKLKVSGIGTSNVINSVKNENYVSPLLLTAVFSGTVLTHLFGGSAGREGAALQMGGGMAAFFAKIFKLDSEHQKALTVAGMAGFFSALFGTPFGAFAFAVEVVRLGKKAVSYILPTFISSITAFLVATLFKVKPERFLMNTQLNVDLLFILKTVAIAVLAAFLSLGFCKLLEFTKHIFKRSFKNEYLRIFAGGTIIILLTLTVGTTDYNGGGINIIEEIFAGKVKYEAFLLKMFFTAVTVAAGFKGGEIIPTFFIGAAFGGAAASLLGLSIPLGAAIGMTSLFCGATKCPVATVVLAAEMFGIKGIVFYIIASALAYFLSGKKSLYT